MSFLGFSFGKSKQSSKQSEQFERSSDFFNSGTATEQLELDQEGIDKILQDALGSVDGLASIFAGEQNAGLYDSTVAAQASGDLVANIIGELAKITGKTVTTQDEEGAESQTGNSSGEGSGKGTNFGFSGGLKF